jgi:hypothetical protein
MPTDLTPSLILFHLFSLFFLTGLIWVVQLVHYPTFLFVAETRFTQFHRFHSQRITWVVAPMMLLEIGTGAALWWILGGPFWLINVVSIALTWLSTGLVSVPIHNRLSPGRDERFIHRLIKTNWLRTATWSARSVVWLFLICSFLKQLNLPS